MLISEDMDPPAGAFAGLSPASLASAFSTAVRFCNGPCLAGGGGSALGLDAAWIVKVGEMGPPGRRPARENRGAPTESKRNIARLARSGCHRVARFRRVWVGSASLEARSIAGSQLRQGRLDPRTRAWRIAGWKYPIRLVNGWSRLSWDPAITRSATRCSRSRRSVAELVICSLREFSMRRLSVPQVSRVRGTNSIDRIRPAPSLTTVSRRCEYLGYGGDDQFLQ